MWPSRTAGARAAVVSSAVWLFAATSASALITFKQLDQDSFIVSHRVKGIGSRGKAMDMVYTKVASVCVAAGYAYYRVLGQESQSANSYEWANASVRVQYYLQDGDERVACRPGSNAAYVSEAKSKLTSQGYRPPSPPPSPPAAGEVRVPAQAAPAGGTGGIVSIQDSPIGACPSACTIEQIAGMARSGLTDEQIVAACSGDG